MSGNSKTKLLKAVCKSAELIHARFHGSSWSNKTNEAHKKSAFVNKIGERFRSKLTKLSVTTEWSSIQKEWVIVKQVQRVKQFDQCLCGKSNLKFITYLKNKKNNNEVVAGNCCLLTIRP